MSTASGVDPSPPEQPGSASATGSRTGVRVLIATILPFRPILQALAVIWTTRQIRLILVGAVELLVAGTILFMFIEDLSPIDAFYFSFSTVSTIGAGDIVAPQTELGKIVTVLYAVAGLGLLAAFFSSIAAVLLKRARPEKRDPAEE